MGNSVDVFTTSLLSLESGRTWRTRVASTQATGTVRYLATPIRFRWMGLTPSVLTHLRAQQPPDIVHIFGFRDPLGTSVATWCSVRGVPYVFEGLGMVEPKLRKVQLKRLLDATVFRSVPRRAALLVATSERERREYLSAGIDPGRIAIRPNGFPDLGATPPGGTLRRLIGIDASTPLVVSVGRVARGKGLDLLVEAVSTLPGVHAAIVGPDGGHGMTRELIDLRSRLGLDSRVHLIGPVDHEALPGVYVDADVFTLPSAHENFGLVAAEAAALGVPVIVSDRCGIAELFQRGGGVVVPYSAGELRSALERVLSDPDLRHRLGAAGKTVAAEWSWPHVAQIQEDIYRLVLTRG